MPNTKFKILYPLYKKVLTQVQTNGTAQSDFVFLFWPDTLSQLTDFV